MRGEAKEYFAVENTSCTMLPMKKHRKEPKLGVDHRGRLGTVTSWFGVANCALGVTNWYNIEPHLGGYEDHASSVGGGVGLGMVTTYIAARLMIAYRPETSESKVMKVAAAATGIVALGASMLLETKTGLQLMHKHGNAEPIDFTVGVGSAVIAGVVGVEVFEYEEEPATPLPEPPQ